VYSDGSGADPSDDAAFCLCDTHWTGRADFVATDGINCMTNTIAIRVMWALAFLVGCYTWILAWSTVIQSWRKIIHTARSAKYDHIDHVRSQVTSGSVPAGAGLPDSPSSNDTGGTGPGAGAGAGASGGYSDGSQSCCGSVCETCHCGDGLVSTCEKAWMNVPTRFAMFASVTGPSVTAVAIMKVSFVDMVGTDTLVTVFASIGLLFFWLSGFNGLHGFVKLNVSILQV
jgi:hypothetical protein